MTTPLRLLGIFAHPDDESLGVGGTLARYAEEGVEVFLVTATRGERGRYGSSGESPGLDVVGKTREQELRAAARELGVSELALLDYVDGDLDRADPEEAAGRIAAHLRRIRPDVVVTFGPDGAYGHPDHIAICQFATAAVLRAATPGEAGASHTVSKLYYIAWTARKWDAYQTALRDLKSRVDGVDRRASPWPDWAITTRIDTSTQWKKVWRAVSCHRTQMAIYEKLDGLSDEDHQAIWGVQEFYRVFSLVNGGREVEDDVFAGLR